jgi:CheY-like chemotaxis protein
MAQILIVDDEASIRWMLADFLDKMGHRCDEARDGLEALKILGSREVDLIMSDVMMPKMDGFMLLKELLPRIHDRIPFVFLSSHSDMDAVQAAIQAGATDYLLKPCREADLREVVNRALERRRTALVATPAAPAPARAPEPAPEPAAPASNGAALRQPARTVTVPVPAPAPRAQKANQRAMRSALRSAFRLRGGGPAARS